MRIRVDVLFCISVTREAGQRTGWAAMALGCPSSAAGSTHWQAWRSSSLRLWKLPELEVMEAVLTYAGLFAVAFLAATLLPAQSEAALIALLMTDHFPALLLVAVASAGNVLGSCLNYGIGRFLAESRRFQKLIASQHRERAESWYRRYGRWSLLGSWLPLIGDPLTVVAGALREPFAIFLMLVAIAKVGRYLVLVALHQAWFG